jgi:hypothetical protein
MDAEFSALLQSYLSNRNPKGATEKEVSELESMYGVRLPPDYREFLLHAGWGADGLWVGSDYWLVRLPSLHDSAVELMADAGLEMPKGAFVFLMHQGYQFFYLLPDGVYYYLEGNEDVEKKAESFAEFFEMVKST